ncbi:MAG: 7-cyano-7-deazaguanine synthase QueC [Pseudomonadota bacterium]
MIDPDRALVLFSGGQDSTVCLAWALDRFAHVETIGFDYRQRHAVELDCRETVRAALPAIATPWGARLGPDHMIDLGVLGAVSETALTRETEIAIADSGLPNTFVPGRNLAFLTFAAAIAYRRGLGAIVGGMCETDYSGYPDCRAATIEAMGRALSLGMDVTFEIHTPLMELDKAQTWGLTETLGGAALVDLVVTETHTCYRGLRAPTHPWGAGCGECPACDLRAAGWRRWRGEAA